MWNELILGYVYTYMKRPTGRATCYRQQQTFWRLQAALDSHLSLFADVRGQPPPKVSNLLAERGPTEAALLTSCGHAHSFKRFAESGRKRIHHFYFSAAPRFADLKTEDISLVRLHGEHLDFD